MEGGFIFCDTPPIKNTDRVSVYLDVDGKLLKTKKPLYFHEPFKVSNISPSVVSPAQNVHLTVSGISCKDWIQYFVRFQTANGTKKTQQGICKDSFVSCYVPEFPPNTRLRVGLTLSNRLVEWADKKILIQYPVDAIRSFVKDIETDVTKKGAFTFAVALRDRFRNAIKVIKSTRKKQSGISVQYSSQDKPKSPRFLVCTMTLRHDAAGDEYALSCAGAEKEHIYFYPSINNVPLGGQEKYEARTTLCPGKNTCEAEPKSFLLVIVLCCVGAAILVSLVAVFIFVRYQVAKKKRVSPETTTELEMKVPELPENEDFRLAYRLEDSKLETCEEGDKAVSPTQEIVADKTESIADSSEMPLSLSGDQEERDRGHHLEVPEQEGGLSEQRKSGENNEQSKKGVRLPDVPERDVGFVEQRKGGQNDEQSKLERQHLKRDSELSAAEDPKESAGSSPSDAELSLVGETLTMMAGSSNIEDVESYTLADGLNISFGGDQPLDKSRKQTAKRRRSRLGNKRVLPTECESTTGLNKLKSIDRRGSQVLSENRNPLENENEA